MNESKKIAIIGTGISGLGCAYHLHRHKNIELTLFEKEQRIGGHSHTIDYCAPNTVNAQFTPIDTGFLVFNRKTYPRLLKLFEELDVPIANSEMSFSVSIPKKSLTQRLEWAGTNLNTVFAQRKNLLNLDFWRMLKDIIRFNKLAKKIAHQSRMESFSQDEHQSVSDFLDEYSFGSPFRNWYLLPMIGAIWSCPISEMMQFPIHTLINFCENHGLLNVLDRPQWLTVKGGSREYVKRILSRLNDVGSEIIHDEVIKVYRHLPSNDKPIEIRCASGASYYFDDVVFACHSDQALNLLDQASAIENRVLSKILYQANEAYVHSDSSLLPQSKHSWAAWNYSSNVIDHQGIDDSARLCVHYLINKLQPVPKDFQTKPIIVSLNPHQKPAAKLTYQRIEYAHPLFDSQAVQAQQELPMMQGQNNTWYCGAWTGYGFHEDGLRSGELVAEDIVESLFKSIHFAHPENTLLG